MKIHVKEWSALLRIIGILLINTAWYFQSTVLSDYSKILAYYDSVPIEKKLDHIIVELSKPESERLNVDASEVILETKFPGNGIISARNGANRASSLYIAIFILGSIFLLIPELLGLFLSKKQMKRLSKYF
ncbi:hypothetical protein [Teredinibacter sp. KSP-S5-2]|uniref:hypothetical protein n=1 Tax=Teredinibacter sp. KSP-S5-2 TaxID=3034506 RepID=UPI0029347C25|nr:hypothetical protein [Teredinibacter sp. KSP-S5-2]WNO10594.1 hypothetical protein P5V12_05345 [Teredinibacter sp. KSP-S5-2]